MELSNLQKYRKKLSGEIFLPASKSISNRVLIINALSYSGIPIDNLADCEDTKYLKESLFSNSNRFYTGAGGTSLRFLTAYLSKIVGEWYLECSEGMKKRPISVLVDALNGLGAQISYLEEVGYPPLHILGSHLTGRKVSLSGSVSSQYISALLLIAPTLPNGLTLELTGEVVSRPYIEMTLRLMEYFGIRSSFIDNKIHIEAQQYDCKPFEVEADWTSASYFYQLLCLAEDGELFLRGLYEDSCQGDAKQVDLWRKFGIVSDFQSNGVRITKEVCNIDKLQFDFIEMPDLVQTFAVTCCLKGIPFHFTGVQTLKIKETNRIEALQKQLAKFGYVLTEPKFGELAWNGALSDKEKTTPITIETYDDHRMAMAFAPMALFFSVIIEKSEVVNKSFPNFWNVFSSLFS